MNQDEVIKLAKEHFVHLNETDFPEMCEAQIDFANAIQSHSGDAEPVAWILKTGHGTQVRNVKPKCEIDLWKPLYLAPPDQTARIKELEDKLALLEVAYKHVDGTDIEIMKLTTANTKLKALLTEARDDVANQLSEYQSLLPYKQHRYDAQEETLKAIDKVLQGEDWDEKRIDTIGQNGNDGLHY
jgi:hypothetical protein